MIQTLTELITFDDFVAQYPNTGGRYELDDGIIIRGFFIIIEAFSDVMTRIH